MNKHILKRNVILFCLFCFFYFLDVFKFRKQLLCLFILSSAQELEKMDFRLCYGTNIRVDLADGFDDLIENLVVLDICARMNHIFLMSKNCAPLDRPLFVKEVFKILIFHRFQHFLLLLQFLAFGVNSKCFSSALALAVIHATS